MKITSIIEYLQIINNLFANKWKCGAGDIWFRGITDDFSLVPGILYKEPFEKNLDELENTIIEEFLNSYKTLHNGNYSNNWEIYALMQHYGLPTRLLDWSKSPLVALYFALQDRENENDAIVWCIDPFFLNYHTSGRSTLFTQRDDVIYQDIKLSAYLPKIFNDKQQELPPNPIAIEPPFSNKRILAQQGCFTVHGSNTNSIDYFFYEQMEDSRIEKIIIDKGAISQITQELADFGIRDENIMQDLNSLSTRIIYDHFK